MRFAVKMDLDDMAFVKWEQVREPVPIFFGSTWNRANLHSVLSWRLIGILKGPSSPAMVTGSMRRFPGIVAFFLLFLFVVASLARVSAQKPLPPVAAP